MPFCGTQIFDKDYMTDPKNTRSSQSTSAPPVWADPLGPSSLGKNGVAQYGMSGAPQLRSQIFKEMGQRAPSDAQWTNVNNLTNRNLSGANLNGSPALDRAMATNRAETLASAADATARTRSQMGKVGMGWSTANQQAAQSGQAAAGAAAGRTNANAYLQNYANERAIQNQAPGQLSAPLDYLSRKASLVSGLSSGGQVITPNTTQNLDPSIASTMMNTYASIMGSL